MTRAGLLVCALLLGSCRSERGAPSGASASSALPSTTTPSMPPPAAALELPDAGTVGVVFSADGARMIADTDVFDTATGRKIASVARGRRAWFSPDGTAVLTQQWGQRGSGHDFHARPDRTIVDELEPWRLDVVGGARRAISAQEVEWVGSGAAAVARVGKQGFVHFADRVEPLDIGQIGRSHRAASDRTLVFDNGNWLVVADLVARVAYAGQAPAMSHVGDVAAVDGHVALCGSDGVYVAKASTPADGRVVTLDGDVRDCSGKGSLLFAQTDKTVWVIDPRTVTVVAQWGSAWSMERLATSRDGGLFHAGASVFDVGRKRAMQLDGHFPSWSSRGALLAIERESSVAVFDPTGDGRTVAWLRGTMSPWRPSGRYFATPGPDGYLATPWVNDDLLATVHDDTLTIWRVNDASPHARIPLRAWPGATLIRYGAVQASPKLASYYVRAESSDGRRETRIALVRLSDLSKIWLARPRDGSAALVVTDDSGAPATIEDLLR